MQHKHNLNNEYMSALAEIIKSHRKKNKKTIYLAAAESAIAKSNWREIELGQRQNINLSTFCKIAEGLDISPWELLKELCEKLGKDFSFTDLD